MPALDQVLQEEINRFMNIGVLWSFKPGSREEARRVAEDKLEAQIDKAEEVIAGITDRPLPNERWTRKEDGQTTRVVKTDGRAFHFDFNSQESRDYWYSQDRLYNLIEKFMNKLPISSRWLVQYKFGERWFSVPITKDTLPEMLDQIKQQQVDKEVTVAKSSMELELSGDIDPSDRVFICHVRQISEMHFIDTTAYEGLVKEWKVKSPKTKSPPKKQKTTKPKKSTQLPPTFDLSKLSADQKAELLKQLMADQSVNYKSREGAFFKYICTLPIDLEKFQIFNRINKHAVDIIDTDNCVVWALKQAGIDSDTIERIKSLIGSRHFPQSKFQPIADDTGISFTIKYYRPTSDRTDVMRYVPNGCDVRYDVSLVLFDDHYMLEDTVPITTYAIKNLEAIQSHPKCAKWTWEQMLTTTRYIKGKDRFEKAPNVQTPIMQIIKVLFECNHFKEIHYGDFAPYATTMYKEKLAPLEKLEYNPKWCTRLKQPYQKKGETEKSKNLFKLQKVVYADFECSTDGIHKPYCICAMTADGEQFYAWGDDCGTEFLNWKELIDGTQIYFHNLSYDINFLISHLTQIIGTPIIKSGRTMQIDGKYNGKCLRFKDSLAIISKRLEEFPRMFGLEGIRKEVFPYKFYDSDRVRYPLGDIQDALTYFKTESEKEAFKQNIKDLDCEVNEDWFDIQAYCKFYCMQDVRILHDGFERFRKDLLSEFDIDAYYFVSISSIANRLFEKEVYWKNKNLYDLAGTPREFISRAVLGGRVMMSDNKKQYNKSDGTTNICDFDAVSLYPSAISRLYTIEGIPKVIPGNNIYWLLDHLMDDDQEEPDLIHFISGFVVEIDITKVNKPRHFPLIVRNPSYQSEDVQTERSVNVPCKMYVDHITLMDLIKYQEIEFKFIRGYYWDGRRDFSIRDCIKNLFNLRLKYKAEDNPVQEIIKLIMNSVYGKTILKPIDHKIVFKTLEDSAKYVQKNYNTIESMEHLYGSNLVKFKKIKPINDHFNFCMFGVNILSMSKRIMNEVMCLAEDLDIHIFYQDTDSMHLLEKDLDKLRSAFDDKHKRQLVGKALGQFHSDFATIDSSVKEMPVAIESRFCGKKSYIDKLQDTAGNIAFHARMKGVPMESIAYKANEMFPGSIPVKYDKERLLFIPETIDESRTYSIMELYRSLYEGQEVEFDLAAGGRPCFDMKNDYSIETKLEFKRKLKF